MERITGCPSTKQGYDAFVEQARLVSLGGSLQEQRTFGSVLLRRVIPGFVTWPIRTLFWLLQALWPEGHVGLVRHSVGFFGPVFSYWLVGECRILDLEEERAELAEFMARSSSGVAEGSPSPSPETSSPDVLTLLQEAGGLELQESFKRQLAENPDLLVALLRQDAAKEVPGHRDPKTGDVESDPGSPVFLIRKCKFMEATGGCKGLCLNLCKVAAEEYMNNELGLPVYMDPDMKDYSCRMRLLQQPLPPDEDPAFQRPCSADKCDGGFQMPACTQAITNAAATSKQEEVDIHVKLREPANQ